MRLYLTSRCGGTRYTKEVFQTGSQPQESRPVGVEESWICIPSRLLNGRNAAQLRQPGPLPKECPPDQANASLDLILSDVTEVRWRPPLARPCCGQVDVLLDKIHRLTQLAIASFERTTLSLDHLQLLRRGLRPPSQTRPMPIPTRVCRSSHRYQPPILAQNQDQPISSSVVARRGDGTLARGRCGCASPRWPGARTKLRRQRRCLQL